MGIKPSLNRLFREEAIEQYLRETNGKGVLRVSPPWTVTLLLVSGVMVASGLLFAMLAKIEVTDRAKGIVRPVSGVRHFLSPASGVVAEVFTRSGDLVRKGSPILNLESPSLQANLLEADQHLKLLEKDFPDVASRQDRLYERQRAGQERRVALAQTDVESCERSIQIQTRHLEATNVLFKAGIEGQITVDAAEEALEQAKRQHRAALLSLQQARQDLVALDSDRQQQIFARKSDLETARTRRNSLDFSLSQNAVASPIDGYVDAIGVRPGDQIQPGQVLAKLVPADFALRVISFLPERNRAFVNVGDTVRLELHQYPYAEYGTLPGRVLAIGRDLASSQEWRDAMGDETMDPGPLVRVEIDLPPAPPGSRRLGLRPGMVADVRFTLRRQRLITYAMAPLERWLH